MFRQLIRTSRWAVPAALVLSALTATGAHADDNGLGDVRAATVRFHSVTQAHKAGYADPGLPCFDEPDQGKGMGTHLVNGALVDDGGALSRTHPEALVYEIRHGSLKLVAVEYIVQMSDSATQPSFMGQPMDANPALGLWTLHAWIYRDNPDGVFEAFNSNVALCPANAPSFTNKARALQQELQGPSATPTQGRPAVVLAPVDQARAIQQTNAAKATAMRDQLADIRIAQTPGDAKAASMRSQLADLRY